MPQRVANVSNLTATIEFMLQQNKSYQLPDPTTGISTPFTVTNKTDTNITIDSNHPLANKTLEFKVTLLDAQPYSG
jgi:FKBP-type peptidyl-prolyl cis-trans isomerase 2